MIDSLKDLKDIYEVVKTQIDRCKEPKAELLQIDSLLKVLVSDPALLKEKLEKDYSRYLLEDFSQGLLKRLIREKSNDEKYLEIIASIFDSYLHLFLTSLKEGMFNIAFIESLRALFEFDNLLHSYNYQISEEQIRNIRLQGQTWRSEIKEGDMLDAMQDENNRCTGWTQAKVIQTSGEFLKLQFILEACNDKLVDRNSLDIAQPGTKTKHSLDWKDALKAGDVVDAYDKSIWNKSTILDISDSTLTDDRVIKIASIAYRIYVEKGSRNDERGNYEGYSNKYDEWVPLYSPRIQPFFTKTQRSMYYDDFADIDEDFDAQFPCEDGHSRVYAVPRLRKCTSRLFTHLMNEMGHQGGFELILQVITKIIDNCTTQDELTIVCTLIEMVSKPYLIYTKDFQKEYFPKVIELAKRAIRSAPDRFLRDINRDKVDIIIRSIDNMQKRNLTKEEREKETEILKLDMSLSCLKSGYLERRIQGIKDLNQIIKNNRVMSSKSITNAQLVQWLKDNEVFALLFDPKKTHLQIVQRLNDIMKLLLQEDELTAQLLEMFWNLSKSDYKLEVYKIVNDVAFYLKKEHFDFILSQIIGNSSVGGGAQDKLSIDDYSCLHEMSKYAKDEDFKVNVNKFFWDIVLKSDQEKMGQLIVTGFNFIRVNKIQLYKTVAPQENSQASGSDEQEAQISTGENQAEDKQENSEKSIIMNVMNNLSLYTSQAMEILAQQKNSDSMVSTENRKKLFLVNHKYSHDEEIDERLQFIKYVSSFSNSFKITKHELNIIYDLLVKKSKISSDQEEFLTWCKSLCESSSISNSVLDLNEVGEFFTEKMKSSELNIKSLPLVGFEFLQHYFLSVNEKSSKLLKSSAKSNKTSKFVSSYNFSGYGNYQKPAGSKDDEDKTPVFKLLTLPANLDQLDIVWNVALQCENPKVVPRAINFLIKVHYQLDEDLNGQKCAVQDALIQKCVDILKESQDEFILNRGIEIIKHIIYEAEKKGTGDVQPHNAVLKGELLERISVKYRSASKKNNIVLSIYSNTTVWEFKKEVSKQFELAPKYLKLERSNGQVLQDLDNGKTLAQIGMQNYESLSAYKIYIEEEIANAPLMGSDGKLSEKAKAIFLEWFKLYSDEAGAMTKDTCALFIKGCTGEHPASNDDRIQGLFNQYDINKDGRIELSEFLTFYETACRSKPETVRENLRAHNVRNDLKKLSEVMEETSFKTEDMPRFRISENQEYFEKLMDLLDRSDSVAESSWDLIQMLATNRILYKRVLELQNAVDPSTCKIDWTKFFYSHSEYKLLYTLQIVEAVMEEGEGQNLERIVVIDEQTQVNKQAPPAPPLAAGVAAAAAAVIGQAEPVGEKENQDHVVHLKKSVSVIEQNEYQKLKSEWTSMFLMNDGIQYIMKVFMDKEIRGSSTTQQSFASIFELKHIAFLLKLLRIFIMAAFSTNKESSVYQMATQVRRSSSIQEETNDSSQQHESSLAQISNEEGSRFKELQTLLAGPLGEEIIEQIDYKLLQKKILGVIAQILSKSDMIFEDKLIIENAMSLWVGCVIHRNELFNEFYSFQGTAEDKIKDCNGLILTGLLFCPYEKVREEFKSALSSISLKLSSGGSHLVINPLKYLLDLLSKNITLISNYHSKQYFDLFCTVIEYYFMIKSIGQSECEESSFNPEQLLSHIIDKIKEYNLLAQELNAKEMSSSQGDDDDENSQESSEIEIVYIGLIQLTSKIIDNFDISLTAQIVEQKNLIEEIFYKFLFSTIFRDGNQVKEIKIQPKKQRKSNKKQTFGKKSKDVAYKLINSLIRRSPLLMNNFMERAMMPLMKSVRRMEQWSYSPAGSSASTGDKSQKYVGLRNLGCICYMNSMMQQFFMIPAFRYNLLCVDDMIKEDIKEYKGAKIDDNMLHQLQKLMAHLELSERSDYNPFEFCFAFKEMDGNPTNTGEQKDCQEFLNLAFDRIENQLKATSRKYLLQSVFGGQTCSQLVCQECGKVKNRIEDFYNLSLTVKDIKSMHESLQKLVEGEVINDYQCDGCGKKVDVSKRTLISQTPNVLIVHLQRIVFNFDSFKNDKLNSYFEFPYQLDLKPYSFYEVMKKENRIKDPKEGEEDEEGGAKEEQKEESKDQDNQWPVEEDCYEYKLVGTTVHSGTANAGHYWSYINTKRGYLEPGQDDPNWNKTENDQWMEFNDSRVSEFSFEKLKDECFGDKQKSGGGSGHDDSGWSSWGSYGKSAYMLVYERRKKRPIKVVVTEEEAKVEGEQILHDEAKNEHFKLIDYREGVEDIAPNKIYMQVHDDNKKFEFDNDIYSQEFFEFVKSILQASQKLGADLKNVENSQDKELMGKVNANSMLVGKKSILDLLAKCFYNQQMKDLVQVLISIMQTDDELCLNFMSQCYNEDNFEYLMMTMLDCPDNVTRVNVCLLVKFIITKLKIKEKAILYDMHKEEILCVSTTDQSSYTKTIETPVAMTTRFIHKCLDSLNTLVAKNWSKFDQFLEMLYCFGVGDTEIYTLTNMSEEEKLEQEKIGIEFLFRQQFIGKACDFLLGRKSPLATPNEKRYEMGGSYSNPNFSSIMKLITKMINSDELIKQYPLMDYEKKLFLQYDLLKVMLGQNQGSKQFGLCLANMCKDNLKFSKKVSKIFIKVINSSTYDNVKNYLKALKPFLMMNDSLKGIKMEWIFGFAHIITRKEYREVNYKFGLEIVNKVNDEAYTYLSPIINSHSEEALLAQLLKCKGRLDTFAINCLKEMLSIMAKDDIISRFIYNSTPPTFQYARYSDWIKPYLEQQKSDLERTSSYVYMKSKYDTIIKALKLYAQFDEKCKSYALEEEQAYMKCKEENVDYLGSEKEWMGYNNEDVLKHYPPQIIIGRQVGEERVMQIYDEHPLATVTIFDQDNDFMYSNPTGFFNLSIPHVELRTSMYQTMSYVAFKKAMYQNEQTAKRVEKEKQLEEERKGKEVEEGEIIDTSKDQSIEDKEEIKEEIKEEGAEESKEESKVEEQKEEVKVEEPVILVKDWYENKKEGPVLMKVHVSNKSQETIKFRVTLRPLETPCNVILPESFMTDTLYQNEYKCIGNFQKIDPSKPWTQVKVELEAVKKTYGQASGFSNGSAASGTDGIKINVYDSNNIQISDSGEVKLSMNMVSCIKCQHMQRSSNIKCDNCSDILMTGSTYDPQNSIYDNYYSAS